MLSLFHHPHPPASLCGRRCCHRRDYAFYGSALSSISTLGDQLQWRAWFTDDYLQHLILFSFGQALLSTVLSIFFGLLLARAFFISHFLESGC